MDIDRKRAYHRKYYHDHREHLLERARARDLIARRAQGIKPRNPGQPKKVYKLAWYYRHRDRINPARNQLRSNRTLLKLRGNRPRFKPPEWRPSKRPGAGKKSFIKRVKEMTDGVE